MCVYNPDIPVGSADFTSSTTRYWNLISHSLTSLVRMQHNFSAAVAIRTVPILTPPGALYCWVDNGDVDSMLTPGFCTWPALRESNHRLLDLGSIALTTRSATRSPNSSDIQLILIIVRFGLDKRNLSTQPMLIQTIFFSPFFTLRLREYTLSPVVC